MTNNENYIGVLDSGVGGLSVLSQLVKLMPEKNYLFFGDTKNVPYGTKTPQEIFNYTKKILEFLNSDSKEKIKIQVSSQTKMKMKQLHFQQTN